MALLAEQLVDEWMNRQGFFTIRGIKSGVEEIDLLGVRPDPSLVGSLEAWHVEVQASFNPNAYISKLSKQHMEELGVKGRNSAKKRSDELLSRTVIDWVSGKFSHKKKVKMRDDCWRGLQWKFLLVHGVAKYPHELELIGNQGIELLPFSNVLKSLQESQSEWRGHSGSDIMDIIKYFQAFTLR